jgi:hypothetical protein
MPKQSFALEQGGPKRLELSWTAFWGHLDVRLDDKLIGSFNGQSELKTGKSFRMTDDGSILSISLSRGFYNNRLNVTRSGVPVPGSSADPGLRVRTAYGIMYLIAALNILIGLLGLLFEADVLANLQIGPYNIVFGLVFLVLAIFAQRQSVIAMWIGVIIFTLDAIIGLIGAISNQVQPSIGGLIFRAILLAVMIQAIPALEKIKSQSASESSR